MALRAGFDGSMTFKDGKPDVLAVAGVLFTHDLADQCEREWKKVIHPLGLHYFRLSDFMAQRVEPYKSRDPLKRQEVIEALITIIERTALACFCEAVDRSDYDALTIAEQNRLGGNPYLMCAVTCMAHLVRHLEVKGITEDVAYVFESGDQGHAEFRDAGIRLNTASPKFKRSMRIDAFTSADKTRHPILQPADMLVWETSHYVRQNHIGVLGRIRREVPCRGGLIASDELQFRASATTVELINELREEFGLAEDH